MPPRRRSLPGAAATTVSSSSAAASAVVVVVVVTVAVSVVVASAPSVLGADDRGRVGGHPRQCPFGRKNRSGDKALRPYAQGRDEAVCAPYAWRGWPRRAVRSTAECGVTPSTPRAS